MREDPVAYLLDRFECNGDDTNFWIFSECGLRRLLERTGWDVCDSAATGCRFKSNPRDGERDERYFCMLRSRFPDPWVAAELEDGWHEMENGSWRWTERTFSV